MLTNAPGIRRFRLGLRLQLILALGFISALLIAVSATSIVSLARLNTISDQTVEYESQVSRLAYQISTQMLLCRRYEKDLFLNLTDAKTRAAYLTKWQTAYTNLDHAIAAFDAAVRTPEDHQQAGTWRAQREHYGTALLQVEQAIANGQITTPAAANAAITPAKDSIRMMIDTALATAERQAATAAVADATLDQDITTTTWLVALIAAVALAIAVIWSLLYPTWLIRPIAALQTAVGQVAAGDLTSRAPVNRPDELGLLARSFNQMAAAIEQRTTELGVANHQLQLELAERARAEVALQKREAYFRALIEQSTDAIALTSREGTLVYVSPATTRIVGYTAAQLVGRNTFDLVHPEDQPRLAQHLASLLEQPNATSTIEARVQHADGSWRDVEGQVTNLLDDPAVGAMVNNFRDITERKQAEVTLADERASLAQRVAERTTDLSAANAQLARAARLKDEFLASMSHELRTPLNTILGMAETVHEGVFGAINDEQTDALRHIEESGRHLLALINDILDLSKVEAGKLELNLEETLIADVCQASLRLVKQMATQKRLKVTCNIDSTVTVLQADARRLKQMLVNLLSNAVKFTAEGGAIGLDVVGDAAAQLLRLTVWDTGMGIAASDLPRLFQPFVQLDSRLARRYTGTGLGLALVDRMTALHGGSVAVESRVGQGSRFTITLPWLAAPLAATSVATLERAQRPVASRAPIQRVLVIEDTPPAAALLTRYLCELGAQPHVHPSGVGALEAVLSVCPDVILLDIQLPDRSGWDVLAQLKADPRVRAIPVVVVSVVDDQQHGLAFGAAAYLVKPISRHQLQDALDTIRSDGGFHTLDRALIGAAGRRLAIPAPVILLAEDEEQNIYTFSTYIEAKGYQVVVARNGAEALERAQTAKPALILMDIQMPGMDGLEAIERIRADSTMGPVPIIALTALAMPGDRERCLAAGADAYLTKPVSLKGLVRAIEAHLQHPAASAAAIHDANS